METMGLKTIIPITSEAGPGAPLRIPWTAVPLATQLIVALSTRLLAPQGSVALIIPPSATDLSRA